MSEDPYKRIEISPGVYQCGCAWVKDSDLGDRIVECEIHKQATKATVEKLERERIEGYRRELIRKGLLLDSSDN